MKIFSLILTIYMLINLIGCTQSQLGITHLSVPDENLEEKELDPKMDLEKHDDAFKQGMVDLKRQLVSRNKGKASIIERKRVQTKLKAKFDKQKIVNLQKLGVYNIGKRLKKPLGKYKNYSNNKEKIFVKKEDPDEDRFGGKLVCNKEVLTFRIDRSLFISCMNEHDDISDFSFSKLFTNYDLMNIMQHKIHETPSKCKVKLAISHNSYNDLTQCLIADRASGGFFKFRNPNSLNYKFKIIKERNER